MTMRLRFGLMAFTALIMRVTAFQGIIACHDKLTVYLDGTAVAPDPERDYEVTISLASAPTVIAAKCGLENVLAAPYGYGLIGSFDDGLVTDTSWRCSGEESAGWTDASFDDSAWASALRSPTPMRFGLVGMSTSAMCIWNDRQSSESATTYCRKNLRPHTTFRGKVGCDGELTMSLEDTEVTSDTVHTQVNDISFPDTTTPFQGKIGCDDELTVYLDGTEVASDTVWNQVNDISLASAPTVIAAKCVNTGGAGGIVGSFDDGVVTDTTWRCSDTEAAGWTEVSFDDSAWASAVESTIAPGLSSYDGVSPSATIIWTSAVNVGTVYCRLILGTDV